MDLYLLLAPLLLIPVVWLLRFTGCTTFGTSTSPNASGVIVSESTVADRWWLRTPRRAKRWAGTQILRPRELLVSARWADPKSRTIRVRPPGTFTRPGESGRRDLEVSRTVLTLAEGDYKVTLKFARLDSNVNIGGRFLVQFKNDPPFAVDASDSVQSRRTQIRSPGPGGARGQLRATDHHLPGRSAGGRRHLSLHQCD